LGFVRLAFRLAIPVVYCLLHILDQGHGNAGREGIASLPAWGNLPHAMAALRNAVLTLLRYEGWTNIRGAFRYFAASVQYPLKTIGALETRNTPTHRAQQFPISVVHDFKDRAGMEMTMTAP
jgi:hypothetical protein